MTRAPRPLPAPDRRFGWRDARAMLKGFIQIGLKRETRVTFHSLARISALDLATLPPARSFDTGDGARLSYRTYAGAGDLHLVLIHGSAGFGDQFHRMAAHLAGAGMATVHTLDMRGHGRSSSAPAGYDCFAADIGDFVAMLRNRGNPDVVLAGHSAGGGLVLNAITSGYAAPVAGCLLLAPFLGFESPTARGHFGGWLSSIDGAGLARAALANLAGNTRLNQRPLIRFNADAYLHDPRYAREWSFDTIFGFGPGPAACRREISDIPVLLLAGDRDDCFKTERFAHALRQLAPQGRTMILPGLGHWDILADVSALAACEAWLGEHSGQQDNNTSDRTMEDNRVQFG